MKTRRASVVAAAIVGLIGCANDAAPRNGGTASWSLHPAGIAGTLKTPSTTRGGALVRLWQDQATLMVTDPDRYAERWASRLGQSEPYRVPPLEQVEESMDTWGRAGRTLLGE